MTDHSRHPTHARGRENAVESNLLYLTLSTLRLHARASAVCLWVRSRSGMRLHAADPEDLPLGELLPTPGGTITIAADEGALQFVTEPASDEAFRQIPLIEDRLHSAAVAVLPIGGGEPPLPAVVCLHLPEIPPRPTEIMFEWVRWARLLEPFLPADSEEQHALHPPPARIHSDYSESIQTLTGGLARRVNELLSTVLPALEQAIRLTGEEEPALRFLRYVEEGLDRTSSMMARLLLYAGDKYLIAESVSMVDCVAEALRRLEPERPPQIRLTASIPTGLPSVVADRVQVVAALMEVIHNGIEAAPDGTEVSVEIERDDEGIAITVTDEGIGMNEEVLRRATGPFFSTKHPADHPGLGLSTAQGCVDRHGGHLSITSRTGSGTKVRLWFPLQVRPPVT